MKSKTYEDYVEKTAEYRRTKLKEWALPERSESEYKQIALATPYNVDDFEGNAHPYTDFKREQMFYFHSRYRFQFVAEFLETIKNLNSKLLFLIEIKADFEHDVKAMWVARVEKERYAIVEQFNFGELCQVEIDRIKQVIEAERLGSELSFARDKEFKALIDRRVGDEMPRSLTDVPPPLSGVKENLNNKEKSKPYEDYINKAKNRRTELLKLNKGDSRRGIATCFPTGILLNDDDFKEIIAADMFEGHEKLVDKHPGLHIECAKKFFLTSLYDIEEITKYLETINPYNKQLEFLVEIEAGFRRDFSKIRWYLDEQFSQNYSESFLKSLIIEINRIKGLMEAERFDNESRLAEEKLLAARIDRGLELPRTTDEAFRNRPIWTEFPVSGAKIDSNNSTNSGQDEKMNEEKTTARRSIFALLLLLYGQLQIPDERDYQRTQIINFVTFVTGKHRQNIKEGLENPTAFKEHSKKSRNDLVSDLKAVFTHFRELGLKKQADIVKSEAKTLLGIDPEDFEKK